MLTAGIDYELRVLGTELARTERAITELQHQLAVNQSLAAGIRAKIEARLEPGAVVRDFMKRYDVLLAPRSESNDYVIELWVIRCVLVPSWRDEYLCPHSRSYVHGS